MTAYSVGIYCRLSREDEKHGIKDSSLSIENQQAMLETHCKQQGWMVYKTYIDDDYSGTNFQRPGFQDMISDVESGLVNLVITKDA